MSKNSITVGGEFYFSSEDKTLNCDSRGKWSSRRNQKTILIFSSQATKNFNDSNAENAEEEMVIG